MDNSVDSDMGTENTSVKAMQPIAFVSIWNKP